MITEVATGLGILATLALPGLGAMILLPLVGVALQGTSSVLYATIGDLVEPDRLPRAFGFFYTLGSICGIAAPLGYVCSETLQMCTLRSRRSVLP